MTKQSHCVEHDETGSRESGMFPVVGRTLRQPAGPCSVTVAGRDSMTDDTRPCAGMAVDA